MNILQKIESKLTLKLTDEAVDQELKGYSINEIQQQVSNYRANIYSWFAGLLLLPFVLFFGISYPEEPSLFNTLLGLFFSIMSVVLLTLLILINIGSKNRLESGLKRKIENNKKGESPWKF